MPRYYSKVDKSEVFEPGPDVVELPPDNPFWTPLGRAKRLTFDAEGIPNGTETIPPRTIPPGSDEAIHMALGQHQITSRRITMALMRAHNGNSSSIAAINNTLAVMADNHNTTVEYIMSLME